MVFSPGSRNFCCNTFGLVWAATDPLASLLLQFGLQYGGVYFVFYCNSHTNMTKVFRIAQLKISLPQEMLLF